MIVQKIISLCNRIYNSIICSKTFFSAYGIVVCLGFLAPKFFIKSQSLIATGFPYTKVKKGKDYEWVLRTISNLLPITRDIRRTGSAAIDLCYVACGKFEAYYECNLKPCDVAAGILIVEEALGKISNEKGEEYTLENHIIASSNALVHSDLLSHIGLNISG